MANSFSQTTRSLFGVLSFFVVFLWLLALVLLGAWTAWFLLVPVTVYEVSKTARVEVERAAHPIAAQTNGKVLSTAMQLEKPVQAGDMLMVLDARSEQLALAEEEARLKSIPPQLAAIERQIVNEEQAAERLATAASNAVSEARQRHREALTAAKFAKEHSLRLDKLKNSGSVAQIDALRANVEAEKTQSIADALSYEINRVNSALLGTARAKHAAVEALRRESAALKCQLARAGAGGGRGGRGGGGRGGRAAGAGGGGGGAPGGAGAD